MSRASIIRDVAAKLSIDPAWLDALINFETAGTYDPQIKNPTSSARGLIQVIDSTARSDFGVADSLALVTKYPDFSSQMYNVVYPYLKKYAPFSTKQSLYMAVFYPAYRNRDPDTLFPENVRAANPGINTPNDYIRWADRKMVIDNLIIPKVAPALILALVVGVIWWSHKQGFLFS